MTPANRILVPTDFTPASESALEYAVVLAKQAGASLVLLHVWDPSPETLDLACYAPFDSLSLFSATPDGARMRACLTRIELDGVPARGCLDLGDPAHAIRRCAAETECDVIVIGAHDVRRRSWLSFGDHVSDRVVRGAPCPVLVVHGAQADVMTDPLEARRDSASTSERRPS